MNVDFWLMLTKKPLKEFFFWKNFSSVPHYIETSQLISKVNQLNGYYMENTFR